MDSHRLADIGITILDRSVGLGDRVEGWYRRLGMLPVHWEHSRDQGSDPRRNSDHDSGSDPDSGDDTHLIWRGDDPWGYGRGDQARLARTYAIGVQEFERAVVLLNGAFYEVMEPGLWEIDKSHRLRSAVQVVWIDMRQLKLKWGVGKVMNGEGITLGGHGVLYAQVTEPQPFLLQVVGGKPTFQLDLKTWLRPAVASAMRAELASYSVQGLMSERDAFQQNALQRLEPVLEAWGIGLRSIEVEQFELPEYYQVAAAKATIRTLNQKAEIIQAEAQAAVTRITAQGAADARLMVGAADAQYYQLLLAQGIDPIKIEWIRALKEYADHPAGGLGDIYKPQLFMQAGQILADPQIPAGVKQDVRGLLAGPPAPTAGQAQPLIQAPSGPGPVAQPVVAPSASPPTPEPDTPLTAERIQQMLDNLDMQLAEGKISEARYDQLYARWEARLAAMRQP